VATDSDHLRLVACRLVVIDAQSHHILTAGSRPISILPRLSVPAGVRTAEFITNTLEQQFGLSTVQLALLPRPEEHSACAVLEVIDSKPHSQLPLPFSALDDISSSELTDDERATISSILSGRPTAFGKFARIGWIGEMLVKIAPSQVVNLTIHHINQGIDFCLLFLTEAPGRKMWFKAVGTSNTREYAITLELARRFPSLLPDIVATIPEWNAWIMEDVQGIPLNDSDQLEHAKAAFAALASMQIHVSHDPNFLFALGAEDWSCARILSLSSSFFEEAHHAMRAQTSRLSAPLDSAELDQVRRNVDFCLEDLRRSGIPDTLLHGDIGHGNILTTSKGPIFLDWAETYIGHPFLSSEHLLADLIRSNPIFAREQSVLRSFYNDQWSPYVEAGRLKGAGQFAPAVAAFAYAVIGWHKCSSLPDPTVAWPLMRSMLRRTRKGLDRALEAVS
jgi:hypothetical protein